MAELTINFSGVSDNFGEVDGMWVISLNIMHGPLLMQDHQ